MNHAIFFHIVSLLALFSSSNHCLSLNPDTRDEQGCFEIKDFAPVDVKWLTSLQKQYYPLMSRLDLIHTAGELLKEDFNEFNPSQLVGDACIEFAFGNDSSSYLCSGFGGRTAEMGITPLTPNFEKFVMTLDYAGISGQCYTTLTDNSTFMFTSCCSSDNEMSWGVVSSVQSLPKDTVTQIHNHASSLGFRKEDFTQLLYDICGNGDGDDEMSLVQVPGSTGHFRENQIEN